MRKRLLRDGPGVCIYERGLSAVLFFGENGISLVLFYSSALSISSISLLHPTSDISAFSESPFLHSTTSEDASTPWLHQADLPGFVLGVWLPTLHPRQRLLPRRVRFAGGFPACAGTEMADVVFWDGHGFGVHGGGCR